MSTRNIKIKKYTFGDKPIQSAHMLNLELIRLEKDSPEKFPEWNFWRGKANGWYHTNGNEPSRGYFLMLTKDVDDLIASQRTLHSDTQSGGVQFLGHRLIMQAEITLDTVPYKNVTIQIPTTPTLDTHPLTAAGITLQDGSISTASRMALFILSVRRVGGGIIDDDNALCMVEVVDMRYIMAMQLGIVPSDKTTTNLSSSFGRPAMTDATKLGFWKEATDDWRPFIPQSQSTGQPILPGGSRNQTHVDKIHPWSLVGGFAGIDRDTQKPTNMGEYWPQIKASNALEWTEKRLRATGRTIVFDYTADPPFRFDGIGIGGTAVGSRIDDFRPQAGTVQNTATAGIVAESGHTRPALDTSGVDIPELFLLLYPVFDVKAGGGPPDNLYVRHVSPGGNTGSIPGTVCPVYTGQILWRGALGDYINQTEIDDSVSAQADIILAQAGEGYRGAEVIELDGWYNVVPSGAFARIEFTEDETGYRTKLVTEPVDWWRRCQPPDFYPSDKIILVRMKEDLNGGVGHNNRGGAGARVSAGFIIGFGENFTSLSGTTVVDDEGHTVRVSGEFFNGCAFGHDPVSSGGAAGDVVLCVVDQRAGLRPTSETSAGDDRAVYHLMAVGSGRNYERGIPVRIYGDKCDVEVDVTNGSTTYTKTIQCNMPWGEPELDIECGISYRQSTGEWDVTFQPCPV